MSIFSQWPLRGLSVACGDYVDVETGSLESSIENHPLHTHTPMSRNVTVGRGPMAQPWV